MPRKKKARPYARIAITLPQDVLAAADRLAQQLDRPRSWVVAESVRRYTARISPGPTLLDDTSRTQAAVTSPLGELRFLQLEADLRLTPGDRVRAAEETLRLAAMVHPTRGEQLVSFDRPEDYFEWKKRARLLR